MVEGSEELIRYVYHNVGSMPLTGIEANSGFSIIIIYGSKNNATGDGEV